MTWEHPQCVHWTKGRFVSRVGRREVSRRYAESGSVAGLPLQVTAVLQLRAAACRAGPAATSHRHCPGRMQHPRGEDLGLLLRGPGPGPASTWSLCSRSSRESRLIGAFAVPPLTVMPLTAGRRSALSTMSAPTGAHTGGALGFWVRRCVERGRVCLAHVRGAEGRGPQGPVTWGLGHDASGSWMRLGRRTRRALSELCLTPAGG